MKIYLLRHGIASPRDPRVHPDDDARPLTPAGKSRMQAAAAGIKTAGITFNLILSSPLPRALQTARIVEETMTLAPTLKILDALAPGGSPGDVLAAIPAKRAPSSLLLVGHEPDLSRLASELLSSRASGLTLEMKKGSLCRIDTVGAPAPGTGTLVFLLPPRILRALAAARRHVT